jgi:hypothetical protein
VVVGVAVVVVSPGTVVVAPASVEDVATVVTVVLDDPEPWFGRTNHMIVAVTTTTASAASTAVTTSRRSRGGFQSPRRLGLIAS